MWWGGRAGGQRKVTGQSVTAPPEETRSLVRGDDSSLVRFCVFQGTNQILREVVNLFPKQTCQETQMEQSVTLTLCEIAHLLARTAVTPTVRDLHAGLAEHENCTGFSTLQTASINHCTPVYLSLWHQQLLSDENYSQDECAKDQHIILSLQLFQIQTLQADPKHEISHTLVVPLVSGLDNAQLQGMTAQQSTLKTEIC